MDRLKTRANSAKFQFKQTNPSNKNCNKGCSDTDVLTEN